MAQNSVCTEGRIAPGVRWRKNKYDAYVRVGRKQRHKYFRPATPLETIYRWQRQARASMLSDRMILEPRPVPALPLGDDGWCYLYVFKSGAFAKIGRSVNPRKRLQALQSSQPQPVEYIAAAPIHASFEDVVHTYFAGQRARGEWYVITEELGQFVDWLQAGRNPLEWFTLRTTHLSRARKAKAEN